jgi:hypothetical protein
MLASCLGAGKDPTSLCQALGMMSFTERRPLTRPIAPMTLRASSGSGQSRCSCADPAGKRASIVERLAARHRLLRSGPAVTGWTRSNPRCAAASAMGPPESGDRRLGTK